ncbi:MAG TPA: hypothetical protein VM577_18845 [Anaerovoracaceae bacterium]|nr:hypothetical protein [Anaerovoracaceae bacterium]
MEKLTENEHRTLVVVYKLAKGMVGVPVSKEAIYEEITNKKIYEMTDKEFDTYHKQAIAEAKLNQN